MTVSSSGYSVELAAYLISYLRSSRSSQLGSQGSAISCASVLMQHIYIPHVYATHPPKPRVTVSSGLRAGLARGQRSLEASDAGWHGAPVRLSGVNQVVIYNIRHAHGCAAQ